MKSYLATHQIQYHVELLGITLYPYHMPKYIKINAWKQKTSSLLKLKILPTLRGFMSN